MYYDGAEHTLIGNFPPEAYPNAADALERAISFFRQHFAPSAELEEDEALPDEGTES